MDSCSALRAVWSLMIPKRIPRTFRPATAESSAVASSPKLAAPVVVVMADTGHLPLTSTRPPLSSLCCRAALRAFASANSLVFGIRAALPELIVIYEPLAITTQARHYATRGSITTASLFYPRMGIVDDLSLSGINSQHLAGQLRGMPTYRLPAFWCARVPGCA